MGPLLCPVCGLCALADQTGRRAERFKVPCISPATLAGSVDAFALNIEMQKIEDAPKRISIGKELLGKLGVY
jgi:hypothetical protein